MHLPTPLLFIIGYSLSVIWLTLLLDYLLEKEEDK